MFEKVYSNLCHGFAIFFWFMFATATLAQYHHVAAGNPPDEIRFARAMGFLGCAVAFGERARRLEKEP